MGCQSLAEGSAVPWSKALSFYAPECDRLNATFVQPHSDSQGWDLQSPQFLSSLFRFLKALTKNWNSSPAGCLMINPQISHNRGDRWLVLLQHAFERMLGLTICGHKGRLLGVDFQAQGCQPVM